MVDTKKTGHRGRPRRVCPDPTKSISVRLEPADMMRLKMMALSLGREDFRVYASELLCSVIRQRFSENSERLSEFFKDIN